MTNIAMENPKNKWRFLAGKSSINGPFYMAMLNDQRVYDIYIYIYSIYINDMIC